MANVFFSTVQIILAKIWLIAKIVQVESFSRNEQHFIIKAIDCPASGSEKHYLMEYSKREKNLIITPIKLSPYQVDRTVSNQFINWRKSFSTRMGPQDVEI